MFSISNWKPLIGKLFIIEYIFLFFILEEQTIVICKNEIVKIAVVHTSYTKHNFTL